MGAQEVAGHGGDPDLGEVALVLDAEACAEAVIEAALAGGGGAEVFGGVGGGGVTEERERGGSGECDKGDGAGGVGEADKGSRGVVEGQDAAIGGGAEGGGFEGDGIGDVAGEEEC